MDPEGLDQIPADFDALRSELAEATKDWTLPVAVRSYDLAKDGEEDQQDEAMIFEEHGYSQSAKQGWTGHPATWRLIATYALTAPPPVTRTASEGSAPAAVSPQAIQAAYCPRCGTQRVGGFQFCAGCGLAFDTIGQSPSGAPGGGWTVPASAPGTVGGTGLKKETLAGAAWVLGALLIGYLAIEQLSAAGTIARLQAFDQSLGVTYTGASQSDYQVSAVWNGVVAVLTAFFAFRLLRDPSDRDLRVSVTWGVINVVIGIIEVANGVSAEAFLAATVVMGAAGIASFAALQERASQRAESGPLDVDPSHYDAVIPDESRRLTMAERLTWLTTSIRLHPGAAAIAVIVALMFIWIVVRVASSH